MRQERSAINDYADAQHSMTVRPMFRVHMRMSDTQVIYIQGGPKK